MKVFYTKYRQYVICLESNFEYVSSRVSNTFLLQHFQDLGTSEQKSGL